MISFGRWIGVTMAAAGLALAALPATTAATPPATVSPALQPAATRAQILSITAPTAVLRGRVITITGALSPARSGAVVRLQVKTGKTWSNVAVARTTKRSRYQLTMRAVTGASVTLRVTTAAVKGVRAAVSRTRTVRLRNGVAATVRKGTVTARGSWLHTVGLGSHGAVVVTVATTHPVPAVGHAFVLPAVRLLPHGYVGVVTRRSRTRSVWTVSLRPGRLTDAWTSLTVSTTTSLASVTGWGTASAAVGAARPASASPVSLTCSGSTGVTNLSAHIDIHQVLIDTVIDLASRTATVTPHGPITGTLSVTTGNSLSCTLHWAAVQRIVGAVGIIPVILDMGPEVSWQISNSTTATVTASGNITATVGMRNASRVTTGSVSGTKFGATFTVTPPQPAVSFGIGTSLTLAGFTGFYTQTALKWEQHKRTDMSPVPCMQTEQMLHLELGRTTGTGTPLGLGVQWVDYSGDLFRTPSSWATTCRTPTNPPPDTTPTLDVYRTHGPPHFTTSAFVTCPAAPAGRYLNVLESIDGAPYQRLTGSLTPSSGGTTPVLMRTTLRAPDTPGTHDVGVECAGAVDSLGNSPTSIGVAYTTLTVDQASPTLNFQTSAASGSTITVTGTCPAPGPSETGLASVWVMEPNDVTQGVSAPLEADGSFAPITVHIPTTLPVPPSPGWEVDSDCEYVGPAGLPDNFWQVYTYWGQIAPA
jgi:hypothetical protein